MSVNRTITQEVYGRAVSELEKQDTKISIPSFEAVNADADESMGYHAEVKALFHELGYLNRSGVVDAMPVTASKSRLGKVIKTLVSKLCFFLIEPVVRQQNAVNMRTESLLRKMLYQINDLTAENEKLRQEVEAMKKDKGGI